MKSRSTIKYLLVFFLFAGLSCEQVTYYPGFSLGTASDFRLNQLNTSTDGQYTFQITELNDSRCPEGAECFWQGEVSLKGEWTDHKNITMVELHSVMSNLQKIPDGFTIQIIDAQPYPKLGNVSKSENLVVTLLIQKK